MEQVSFIPMQLRRIRGWEGNSTCKMSAWWNFCPQSLDKMGGNLTTKKEYVNIWQAIWNVRLQSEMFAFYRQLLSVWGSLNSIGSLMPINHTSHPDFRSILRKPTNVHIWLQSCVQVVHSGNHTQVAKSCKVTVGGADRHDFIPRLVTLSCADITLWLQCVPCVS